MLAVLPPGAPGVASAAQPPLGGSQTGSTPDSSVVDGDGKMSCMECLYVAGGGVVPASVGVNPQLPIMAVATRIAHRLPAAGPR